jgi:hypothetical protein
MHILLKAAGAITKELLKVASFHVNGFPKVALVEKLTVIQFPAAHRNSFLRNASKHTSPSTRSN